MAAQLASVPLINVMLVPGEEGNLLGHVWDVATQQWVPMCGSHHPQDDADKEVQAFWAGDQRVFTILGFGLGHFAAAFARKLLPWQRLGIFELSPALYKAAMYTTDLAPLIAEGKRVDLFVGDALDASMEHFYLSLATDEKMAIATPMRGGHTNIHMRQEYDRLSENAVDYLRHHGVGLATWQQFGPDIGRNDVMNTPEYVSLPGLNELKNLWKGKPAVCIAAGPSLQKNLLQLLDASVRPHLAVITAGTTYALVQGLGLAPDLVCTIDFQRLNYTDQFQDVPLDPACPLLYLHSTYPETVRRWPGPRFVACNGSDYTGWMRQYTEPKYEAAVVQTVAHLNVLAAIELGCDPVILLGQDLAMPKDAHHASGARAQDTCPDEQPEAFLDAKDYAGNPTQTRHSFLTMQQTFERIKRMYPEANIINCTEGGLALEGIPNRPLVDVLNAIREIPPAQDSTVPLRHLAMLVAQGYKPQTRWDAMQHDLQEAIGDLGTCREWAATIQRQWGAYEAAPTPEGVQAILDEQGFVPQRHALYSLMAVRRFDFMQEMSIAPAPEMVNDQPAIDRFNAERVVKTARMMESEIPVVRQLLTTMARRLDDAASYYEHREPCSDGREILTLMARQSWHIVRDRLALHWPEMMDATWHRPMSPREATRIALQLAWHMQCYAQVVSLTSLVPHARKRQDSLAKLHADALSTATAAPAYWHPVATTITPPSQDQGDWA